MIICTAQYIIECIENGAILDLNSNIIFKPLKNEKGIQEIIGKTITLSQFKDTERTDLIYLINNIGANFTHNLVTSETDYLIIKEPAKGEKFVASKGKDEIKIVKKEWLEDTLKNWKVQNPKNYYPKEEVFE